MRITTKGQVTIPQHVREELGLLPGCEVEFIVDGDTARIVKLDQRATESRGHRIVARMRGRGSVPMTTDEILALTRAPK